jgi:hypothetical protein
MSSTTVVGGAKATHGKKFAATFDEDDATVSESKSASLTCLVIEIDAHQKPRKALADDCGKTEQAFSKMTGGTQAFGLDDFERLPRDLQVKWMQRYGREFLGVTVREIEPAELNEELLGLVDRIVTVRRLAARVGRPTQAKAELPQRTEKRAANG